MSRIDELIAYNKSRVPFYDEEIKRMEKLDTTTKLITEAEQDQWIEDLELERRCLRDTISYLEAFKKHGVQP
jgi:nicotinic acid mononucleotide adenylyltransferase